MVSMGAPADMEERQGQDQQYRQLRHLYNAAIRGLETRLEILNGISNPAMPAILSIISRPG